MAFETLLLDWGLPDMRQWARDPVDALRIELAAEGTSRKSLLAGVRLRVEQLVWTCPTAGEGVVDVAAGHAVLCFSLAGFAVLRSSYDHQSRVVPAGHTIAQRGPSSLSARFGEGGHEWIVATWAFGQGPLMPGTLVVRPTVPQFESVYERIVGALRQSADRAEGLVLSAAQEAAVYLLDTASSFALAPRKGLEDPNVDAAAIAARQDPVKPWKLASGADIAGYSDTHFSRIFQEQAGVGFREFVELCRTERAAALLHSTELPVDLVADMAGFASTPSMRQAFRKAMGLSPSDLRAKGPGY